MLVRLRRTAALAVMKVTVVTMVKRRLDALEKKVENAGVRVCSACWSSDGRWGWVPLFESIPGDAAPYNADGRCPRCGAEPREVVALVTRAS